MVEAIVASLDRGDSSEGPSKLGLLVVCNYRTIVCELVKKEKSPFEGGRGMTNRNYKTIT
jgi:hypothetical protein